MTKSQNQWNDKRLIEAITGVASEREAAMRHIFHDLEWKNMVIHHVQGRNGNEQDGEDVFQETIILFDRNLRQGRFDGASTLKTYFYAIAKWYWLGQLRKRRPQVEFAEQHQVGREQSVDVRVMEAEKKNFLDKAIDQLGERCKKILIMYGRRLSTKEIAEKMSLANAHMAKKATYRCRRKLSEFFDDNPEWVQYVK